ncbi:hypothetical protein [Aliivibrio wodanis]|uniref:hypothetical protein n=1 Tax=Aliivibrio wodanis TaxID=80852 RepID=UPI00406C4EF7
MIEFLKNYGVLVSVSFSFVFLLVGWFVVLNGTKYITSRNEAKSTLNDLNNILDDTCNNSSVFWSDFTSKTSTEKKSFYKNGTVLIGQIKRYKILLAKYGIEVLDSTSIRNIKENLTLAPSLQEIQDTSKLTIFLDKKTYVANTLFNKIILDNNYSFMNLHKPVHEPLLDKFRLYIPTVGAGFAGFTFSILLICLYFYIGNQLFPL